MTVESVSLAGEWRFVLDRNPGEGLSAESKINDKIHLPGSLQEQGFGDIPSLDTQWTGLIMDKAFYDDARYAAYREGENFKIPFWLQPERHYCGVAWYQREIEIPASWRGRRVVLTLERPHIQTTVWLGERSFGSQNSLATPHVYDFGADIAPGRHRLTIKIDNRLLVDVGTNSHSVTDHTQTNWNGIVGRIELSATSPVWIEEVHAFPNVAERSVRLQVQIGNVTKRSGKGLLRIGEQETSVQWNETEATLEITHSLPADTKTWDEFQPVLQQLELQLIGDEADHHQVIRFGLREVGVDGSQITVNGRKIFLRGTLECAVFPLTGYPPTEPGAWQHIFQTCRDYGFNHLRFHSWCPPEAAFMAADELGIYLQVECSSWANSTVGLGLGQPVDQWLYDEGRAIIKAYGNHPSFLLMAYGNEPGGNYDAYLAEWVEYWKCMEPRRLHTGAGGWPSLAGNQFDNVPEPRLYLWGEGLASRLNALPPSTRDDFRLYVEDTPRPVVAHETGQWCAYPDFSEIPKYTGQLKAKNFEIFRTTLEANHLGHQARDFLMASGKLQVLCYREEIEAALRTKGLGGFQLLQATDFPGQGTALVGWLNAFWESKGYVLPEEFRRFHGPTVLLARFGERVYSARDTFSAEIEISHFGAEPWQSAVQWELVDEKKTIFASGELPSQTIPVDNGTQLGKVEIPLTNLPAPAKYRFVVRLADHAVKNDWEIWVYPFKGPLRTSGKVHVFQGFKDVLQQAEKGGRALYLPQPAHVAGNLDVGFTSVFWSTAWTKGQKPHTLGLLCDPQHPLFAQFPTEFHTNWQWWELLHHCPTMILDGLPPGVQPLVQVVDDWFTNRRLGLVFECKVGECSVVVCSMDLCRTLTMRHSARQFRKSLLSYMESEKFAPRQIVTESELSSLFKV